VTEGVSLHLVSSALHRVRPVALVVLVVGIGLASWAGAWAVAAGLVLIGAPFFGLLVPYLDKTTEEPSGTCFARHGYRHGNHHFHIEYLAYPRYWDLVCRRDSQVLVDGLPGWPLPRVLRVTKELRLIPC